VEQRSNAGGEDLIRVVQHDTHGWHLVLQIFGRLPRCAPVQQAAISA
jgi:hypothetical protein